MARRARVTLEIIIEAAAEIADTNGLNEVTLAALAEKLNIASPSLYNHINGLQELRKELAIYSMEKLYNDLVYSTVGKAGDDAVRALGKAYITFVRNHPGLYDSTFLSSDANDIEVQKAARKVVELSIQILSAYGLEEEVALHVTRGLRSIFHGFSSLEQKGGFGIQLDINLSYQLLIDTYLEGLRNLK